MGDPAGAAAHVPIAKAGRRLDGRRADDRPPRRQFEPGRPTLLRWFDDNLHADLAVAGGRCGARRASRRGTASRGYRRGRLPERQARDADPLNMLLEARLGTRAFRRLMGGDRPTRGGVGNAPAESPRRLPGTLGGGTGFNSISL